MSQFAQASILVVDTDLQSLCSIATILSAQNHRLLKAGTATEATEIAQRETLDLLIADTWLNGQSGIDLANSLRNLPDKQDLPVMFISANQVPGVIRRTHDLGSAFHLKKPIDQTVLCELVDKALWMPHLVSTQLREKLIRQPHVAFAKNPFATPLESALSLPGTPITF